MGRRKRTAYGPQDTWNDRYSGEFCGLSFSFIYPTLVVNEVITPELPMSADKKKRKEEAPIKAYDLQLKYQERNVLANIESFETMITLLQPHPHPSSMLRGGV